MGRFEWLAQAIDLLAAVFTWLTNARQLKTPLLRCILTLQRKGWPRRRQSMYHPSLACRTGFVYHVKRKISVFTDIRIFRSYVCRGKSRRKDTVTAFNQNLFLVFICSHDANQEVVQSSIVRFSSYQNTIRLIMRAIQSLGNELNKG